MGENITQWTFNKTKPISCVYSTLFPLLWTWTLLERSPQTEGPRRTSNNPCSPCLPQCSWAWGRRRSATTCWWRSPRPSATPWSAVGCGAELWPCLRPAPPTACWPATSAAPAWRGRSSACRPGARWVTADGSHTQPIGSRLRRGGPEHPGDGRATGSQ